MTYADLRPGHVLRGRVVRAVEPCGTVVDVQVYDDAPDVWHTFAAADRVRA